MDDKFTELIKQGGFPAAVCAWFMFRMEKRWDRIVEVLADIRAKLGVQSKPDKEE